MTETLTNPRIILSAVWVALMLTYLLGDVIRIFLGDFVPGEIGGVSITPGMGLVMAGLMLIPIVMVVVTLVLPYPLIRWVTIVAAVFLFLFNLAGLSGYPGLYDKFLIIVGLVFNALSVWVAWRWV